MTKPVHTQTVAGSAFHQPFCPDGRAALDLRLPRQAVLSKIVATNLYGDPDPLDR